MLGVPWVADGRHARTDEDIRGYKLAAGFFRVAAGIVAIFGMLLLMTVLAATMFGSQSAERVKSSSLCVIIPFVMSFLSGWGRPAGPK